MWDFLLLLQSTYITYKSVFDVFISNSETQKISNGLLNYNKHLIESKKNLQTEHSALQFQIQKSLFISYVMLLTTTLELHSSKKNQFGKMELVLTNSRFCLPTELKLSTILCESSAIIYALSKYEFLIQGSKHPIILYTDHKPILFLFTQKNKENHRVYKFQLILMKFPNLHIVWTEGKNFSLPDLLSRSLTTTTQAEHRLRTVEIPESIKFDTQPKYTTYTVLLCCIKRIY